MLKTNKKLQKHLQKRVDIIISQIDINNIDVLASNLKELEVIKEIAQENNIYLNY